MNKWEIVSVLLLAVVISLFALGLRFSDSKVDKVPTLSQVEGMEQYFTDHEFSDVVEAWGKIYGSGVDGVFVIETGLDGSVEGVTEVDSSGLRYVKALVFSEEDQVIYVGHSHGIALYDGAKFIEMKWLDDLRNKAVNDILISDTGKIYIGTYEGLVIVDQHQVSHHLTVDSGLPGDVCNVLYEDMLGHIWCGTYMAKIGGIVRLVDDQPVQVISMEEGLVHNAITTLTGNQEGEILVGGGVYTIGGANKLTYNGDHWTISENITYEKGLAGEKVRHIFVDAYSRTWFCSEYDGISIFNLEGQSEVILTQEDGLSDNEVKKIIMDSKGDLWMATRKGITRMRKTKWSPKH